jgi:hypothetical protein
VTGKPHPVEVDSVPVRPAALSFTKPPPGRKVVGFNAVGERVTGTEAHGDAEVVPVFVSHFTSCPRTKEFRRGKRV